MRAANRNETEQYPEPETSHLNLVKHQQHKTIKSKTSETSETLHENKPSTKQTFVE